MPRAPESPPRTPRGADVAPPPANRGWSAALGLFALAVAGQAASLSLINAPRYAVYQHFLPWDEAFRAAHAVPLVVLAVQATVCLWLGYRSRATLWRGLNALAPGWFLLLAALVMVFAAAVPTASVTRFAGEVVLAGTVMALAALTLVLAVRAMPRDALAAITGRCAPLLADEPDSAAGRWWARRLPVFAALWVLVVTGLLAWFVWERMPHIDDSIAYLFQAKYLSLGRLWLPRPADPDSFGVAHLLVDGPRWYGKFFPGWPAVLALGVLVHLPWLVNPVLATISILLAHRLVRRHYGVGTAHAAVLLLAVSPWFLFMSASFMAHTASLFWLLVALVAIDAVRDRGAHLLGVVAGVALGMLFLTRPFDAAQVGPVAGLWALGRGPWRPRLARVVTIGVSAALVTGLYFAYNALLTGHALTVPHHLWADQIFGPGHDNLGFGPGRGVPMWSNMDPLPGHGFLDVVLNANKNFFAINFELFGWAAGSLVLALLALQPAALRRRDLLLLGIAAMVVIGHAFYWFPGGPDLGARYWYLTILTCVVLTVRGITVVAERLSVPRARVAAFAVLASVAALGTVLPWRIVTKHYHYRDITGEVRALATREGIHNGLVFVRGARRSDYQEAFNLNPPSLDQGGTIYAWDQGPAHRARVLHQFPQRPVWLVERDPDPDQPIRLVAGPLPPGTDPGGVAPVTAPSLQAVLP